MSPKSENKLTLVPSDAPRAASEDRLAVDGGKPVRTEPLPGPYPGALLMGKEEEREVLEVLRSRGLFRYYGPEVLGKCRELERRLAARVGTKHALAVNSGTSALKCALFALGVGPGDEVLVPAYSYVATADVVLSLGARPVFVEIDQTMTLCPIDLAKKLHAGVKAVCVVHLFGVPADMDAILAVTRPLGVPVLEDCAQSLGANYRGRSVGQIGDVGIYSFQLNKIITAGEGGAVVTSRAEVHERAVRLHDHGNDREGDEPTANMIGEGLRLGELSAAVLLAQLGRVDEILGRLRTTKRQIVGELAGVAGLELSKVPDPEGDAGVAVTFAVESAERAARVIKALNAEGIRVLSQYGGKPIYQQPAIRSVRLDPEPLCPRTQDLVARTVFLGLSTTYSKRDVADVVRGVKKVLRAI
ncbi:MAG: DegT/DnrJ/EryC1/StrS family aminotransferase [Polyangiaceae bacterium]|nr:DegT/DnrJ/EryC1/StrS family aminotransferase [Polyangiaceae bacterium]